MEQEAIDLIRRIVTRLTDEQMSGNCWCGAGKKEDHTEICEANAEIFEHCSAVLHKYDSGV